MLKLTIFRPNTVEITLIKKFENYADLETWLESKMEKLADKGWNLTETRGSNSKHGSIECVNRSETDILIYSWETVKE